MTQMAKLKVTVNIPLQDLDRHVLKMGAISGPYCQIGALHWHHFTSLGFLYGWQKHSGKADQPVEAVNMHSYLIIAISWGNKMNFSLYTNMAGFCSDSHIFHAIN